MSKILISYRREDSADVTGRIYDRLIQVFPQSIFRDVDSIPLGVDFRAYLDEQVAKCDVFLAVIGRDWMKAKGRKGKSRLEDPGDFVRIEIESALKRQIPVIPVLVQGVKIPAAECLPSSIQDLSYRHAINVRVDPDFHRDMDRLIEFLRQQGEGLGKAQAEPKNQSQKVLEKKNEVPAVTRVRMVKVPKGTFLYGDEKTQATTDHDYWIDQYPVTNEKYRVFMLDSGYENHQWWSPEGWRWRMGKSITSPEYWKDEKWNKANHPVVGVSYYEAEAYAKWAGKRLPIEQEWEKAARGEDGRQYPWGEEFDNNKCNSRESAHGHTTPVTQYPNGVGSCGCYDMAGNVWEWCASWYNESGGQRVVRGGSWFNVPVDLRVSSRHEYNVGHRLSYLGFRLVQDLP